MSLKEQTLMTPYLQFNRDQWAALRDSVPMTLTEEEITRLKASTKIFPWKSSGNLFAAVAFTQFLSALICAARLYWNNFLALMANVFPYIISIAGSVAVGRALPRGAAALLSRWPEHRRRIITTDGFCIPTRY